MLKTLKKIEYILKFKKNFMKKGFLILAAWYVAWVVATSIYGRNGSVTKRKLTMAEKDGTSKFKVLFDSFVDTHKSMMVSLKDEITSEKNMKIYNEYKEEVLGFLNGYIDKWNELMEELKDKGIEYKDKALEKMEELYNSQTLSIDNIKGLSADMVTDLKEKVKNVFDFNKNEIEKQAEKIKKGAKDVKKEVEKKLK